ncbi:hypothetical protein EVAR_75754_1 [Eumeta japonica]|uniref:Uncharacterized protein n=1 Tax=Eumeta variegata TaxID=151549 RepID=A0A4C1TCW9_EUMVA|nr:hypothetical protein EVAR_75754_1 [Eumeta japonica]
MDELSVKCLLYADLQVILAPLGCGLQERVEGSYPSLPQHHKGQHPQPRKTPTKTKVTRLSSPLSPPCAAWPEATTRVRTEHGSVGRATQKMRRKEYSILVST